MSEEHVELRTERHGIYNTVLSRNAYLVDSNMLRQELKITYQGQDIDPVSWDLAFQNDPKRPLKALDKHWEQLRKEWNESLEQFAVYYTRKGRTGSQPLQDVIPHFIDAISEPMLYQHISTRELESGHFDPLHFPLCSDTTRAHAIRTAARKANIDLDPFELNLMDLEDTARELGEIFERDIGSMQSMGAQSTASDEEDNSWRGEPDEDDSDDGVDTVLEMGDEPNSKPATVNKNSEPWLASTWENNQWHDHDLEDAQKEDSLHIVFSAYLSHIHKFTDAANRLWADAAEQLYEGKSVTRNEVELAEMCAALKRAESEYESFQGVMEHLSLNAYEARELLGILEESNPLDFMRTAVEQASKASQLGTVMNKFIIKQSGREGGMWL